VALVHWKTIVSIASEAEWTLQNIPLIHFHYCWVLILDTPLFLLITLTVSYLLNFRLQSSCVSTLLVPAHQQGSWTYQIISNRSCGWKLIWYLFHCWSSLFWLYIWTILTDLAGHMHTYSLCLPLYDVPVRTWIINCSEYCISHKK
jgi:hypothetical protein